MAHIAFFVIPFTGHINPTLGVAAELAGRGHEVSYPCTRAFEPAIAEAGARPLPYQTTMSPDHAANGFRERDDFTMDDFLGMQRDLLREALATLAFFDRAFAAHRPDLVIYDPSCWAGRLLAARWAVPGLQSTTTFAANRHWSLASGYARFDRGHPGLPALIRAIEALLARAAPGLSVEDFFESGADIPKLVFLTRAFQFAGETFEDDVHFVGPCLGARRFQGTWSPPVSGRPVLLISLGTIQNREVGFFNECVDAFAGSEWHVVVAAGTGADAVRAPGPHIEVHRSVPQLDVLAHADVFVNHAGTGSIMESLAFGVPMVVIPQTPEQRAAADRVIELGLGELLPPDEVSSDALRRAVRTVAGDRGIRARIQAMRGEIRAAGGARAAAEVVEGLLGMAGPRRACEPHQGDEPHE